MSNLRWLLVSAVFACSGEEPEGPKDPGPTTPTSPPIVSTPAAGPVTPTSIDPGQSAVFTVTGLDDRQAFRVTLVADDLVTVGPSGATFVDDDANGAADPGPTEYVARIVRVNDGNYVPGEKTVPRPEDDPAAPTGLYPYDGSLEIEIEGVGYGAFRPVVYHNGGASTFLELDEAGAPVETYVVGDTVSVAAGPPSLAPAGPSTVPVGDYVDVTITDVSDDLAYRVTLVVEANVAPGPDQSGTFLDEDANGYADAGGSELVALITDVNGAPWPIPAKTVPDGTDDPAAPTGVYPVGGTLTVRVTGVGDGAVVPVAYVNGGATTFLEVTGGSPTEPYAVGGVITVE